MNQLFYIISIALASIACTALVCIVVMRRHYNSLLSKKLAELEAERDALIKQLEASTPTSEQSSVHSSHATGGNAKPAIDPKPSEVEVASHDKQLVDKAVKYVEDNIANPDLSVEELAKYLGMSRVHLYKKLVNLTEKTPVEFIRLIRIRRAAQLLHDKQQSISDVAYQVGFNSPKYFTKYFKDEYGVLPSAYQAREADSES